MGSRVPHIDVTTHGTQRSPEPESGGTVAVPNDVLLGILEQEPMPSSSQLDVGQTTLLAPTADENKATNYPSEKTMAGLSKGGSGADDTKTIIDSEAASGSDSRCESHEDIQIPQCDNQSGASTAPKSRSTEGVANCTISSMDKAETSSSSGTPAGSEENVNTTNNSAHAYGSNRPSNVVTDRSVRSRGSTRSMHSVSTTDDAITAHPTDVDNIKTEPLTPCGGDTPPPLSPSKPKRSTRVLFPTLSRSMYDHRLLTKLRSLFPNVDNEVFEIVVKYEKLNVLFGSTKVLSPAQRSASKAKSTGGTTKDCSFTSTPSSWAKIMNSSESVSCAAISYDDWRTVEERAIRKIQQISR